MRSKRHLVHDTGNRHEDAQEKLAIAERVYVEKVMEIDTLLTPYFTDAEIRRTIAESADPCRIAFKHLLAWRGVAEGRVIELAWNAQSKIAQTKSQNRPELRAPSKATHGTNPQ